MKVYGNCIRFLRCCARGAAGWRSEEPPVSGPAVYLVHHQNLYGPFQVLAFYPKELRPWIYSPFCGRKECFDQYYRYTFTKRFGMPKPIGFTAAGICSVVIPALMRDYRAIPVYRDGRRIRETMSLSQQALERGESLLICPDVDYSNSQEETGKIYQGFLRLEKDYFKRTGQHLAFVPMACAKKGRKILFGAPVYFEDSPLFKQQQDAVAKRLIEGMNTVGKRAEAFKAKR